jgi:hypothetical protein
MNCPKCTNDCDRMSVDVGVGIIYGPWGCPLCGWSEVPEYDHSEGDAPADNVREGWFSDQFGCLHNEERQREIENAVVRKFSGAIRTVEVNPVTGVQITHFEIPSKKI